MKFGNCFVKIDFKMIFVVVVIFRKLMKNFNESNLDISKSAMLARIIGKICKTQNRAYWIPEKCSGLKLQPKESVDPIPNEKSFYFFDTMKMEIAMRLTQNATLIHATREQNLEIWQQIDTTCNAFQTIAKRNCPQIYADSEYFL